MQVSRRAFLGSAAAMALFRDGFAAPGGDMKVFAPNGGQAADFLICRRLYLDICGRIPTPEEVGEYTASRDVKKREKLVERLLETDDYADYWAMRYCDVLRVKSEFPINLWPNAVYVFHRRIHAFVKDDEPWDRFARALLTATGSDFRDAEVNFLRATAQRTPEGFAEIAARTFLGWEWADLPEARRRELADYFSCVRIKNTREWKEEIVQVEGEDRRANFAARLLGEWRDDFAKAFVRRVDAWLFGLDEPDPRHVALFVENGYRLRPLVRALALSPAYARGPVTGGFPYRRLDAEVLDDAICDLTDTKRDYQSIAPEPFTFLPANRRSVLIEDGSISNAFLLLFGRPARDTGRLDERHNGITAKQRLYLFNSGKIFQGLGRMVNDRAYRRQSMAEIVQDLYWRFYARPPTPSEKKNLLGHFKKLSSGAEKWRFPRDLAWCLLNSREFLYQH